MDDVFEIGVPIFGMVFLFWAFFQAILRWREISRETQIMSQLVGQLRGGEEAVAFLESSSARALFDGMVDRRTLVLQRVLRALQSGIVLVVLGVAIFVIGPQATTEDAAVAALVFGTLSLALGIAFLLAAGASYALSQRWGLLE
jgi:nitrate reductase gamma subunit